ncbi:Dual-specificity RNA methyltransferase RlmN,partial [Buchnera aphidicola (Tuberolachnus salignus)]|uniref:Dual-specificity RNA methyltransferase RlmN n=1 Tax=Buchnera aphidicola subsp. Tuberolachnus salignus TaxID=98804 RepID=A0A170PBR6_BUCTT|nr:23S rRNA (adenine(2503)-C(2))-methyltransferase RlmN [Buchnera aphidicola]CUR53163.1 Dual-specificity RNA methyltransferase RlmN,partial [Buchnera aphidicola (Tuberolachnus salignus)]
MDKKSLFKLQKNKKINLLSLNFKKMQNFCLFLGEKKFRAQQIMHWIYKKFCKNFDDMINLNFSCKEKLKKYAVIKSPIIKFQELSKDGTIKLGFLFNKKIVETLYIPDKKRVTLCISSQIGCPLKCTFCATGTLGFTRNLFVEEIIVQVWYIMKKNYFEKEFFKKKITNIVFMGMGEPLLNFKNIKTVLKILTHKYGGNFSKHKITLSTSGIIPALKNMIKKIDISLAISLHAPNDKIRNFLMPINKKYNIRNLLNVIKKYLEYSKANRNRVTIEYVMLKDINDQKEHALELSKLLHNISCKINLIPWNIFPFSSYASSPMENIINFSKILIKKGFITTIRKNRGSDINASCGQLVGKNNLKNILN